MTLLTPDSGVVASGKRLVALAAPSFSPPPVHRRPSWQIHGALSCSCSTIIHGSLRFSSR